MLDKEKIKRQEENYDSQSVFLYYDDDRWSRDSDSLSDCTDGLKMDDGRGKKKDDGRCKKLLNANLQFCCNCFWPQRITH